jgi:hypothetical protein
MKDTTRVDRSITQVCLDSCDKALNQIQRVKQAILAQFRDLKSEHEHALRLALNEAEALAWETAYPQLVFADLAEEKARALSAWSERQRTILS